MKGFAPLDLLIAVVMFTLTVINLILIPTSLRRGIVRVVEYEYNYNNAQLALLTLLSTTQDGEPLSKFIAEHIVLNEPDNIEDILKEKLDKIVESKCYELSIPSESLIKSSEPDCDPKDYTAKARIALPYGSRLTEEITLVIN